MEKRSVRNIGITIFIAGIFLFIGALCIVYTKEKKDAFVAYVDLRSKTVVVTPQKPLPNEPASIEAAIGWASRKYAELGPLSAPEAIDVGGEVKAVFLSFGR